MVGVGRLVNPNTVDDSISALSVDVLNDVKRLNHYRRCVEPGNGLLHLDDIVLSALQGTVDFTSQVLVEVFLAHEIAIDRLE